MDRLTGIVALLFEGKAVSEEETESIPSGPSSLSNSTKLLKVTSPKIMSFKPSLFISIAAIVDPACLGSKPPIS